MRYEREDGKPLTLNFDHGYLVSTVTGANGYSVNLSTSQGYAQVGETVDTMTVSGQPFAIQGYILNGNTEAKNRLMEVFSPLSRGRLYWEGKYFLDVRVKESPVVSQERTSKFSLTLFAPYPFWRAARESFFVLGGVMPTFRFPVNYAAPHRFGTRTRDTFFNCVVLGHVPTDYRVEFSGTADISNPSITNVYTQEKAAFTGTIRVGQKLVMYREDSVLKVAIEEGGVETDAFDMLDEDSTLFQLMPGDNLLRGAAEAGEDSMRTAITFNDAYAGVLANGV